MPDLSSNVTMTLLSMIKPGTMEVIKDYGIETMGVKGLYSLVAREANGVIAQTAALFPGKCGYMICCPSSGKILSKGSFVFTG